MYNTSVYECNCDITEFHSAFLYSSATVDRQSILSRRRTWNAHSFLVKLWGIVKGTSRVLVWMSNPRIESVLARMSWDRGASRTFPPGIEAIQEGCPARFVLSLMSHGSFTPVTVGLSGLGS